MSCQQLRLFFSPALRFFQSWQCVPTLSDTGAWCGLDLGERDALRAQSMLSKVRKTGVGASVLLMVSLALTACGPGGNGLHQRSDSLGSSTIVISQVFGGGGSSGATVRNDFAELHNVSNASVSLNGMTLQYAAASGTSWAKTDLPNALIPAGGYFLIALASSGNAGATLAADFSNATMNLAQGDFKLALAAGATALSGSCPIYSSRIIDFLGTGSAGCYEGLDTAIAGSVSRAVVRRGNGCTDTDDNHSDFDIAAPAARSSLSAIDTCRTPPPVGGGNGAGGGNATGGGTPTEPADAGIVRSVFDAGISGSNDDAGPAGTLTTDAGHTVAGVDAVHIDAGSSSQDSGVGQIDAAPNTNQPIPGGNSPSWNATTSCSSVPLSEMWPAVLVFALRRQRRWPTK